MDLKQRFRVHGHGFRLAHRDPGDVAGLDKDSAQERREADLERLADLQERLYAERRRALLVVLQGLDASGKDSTIKHVMSGVDPERGHEVGASGRARGAGGARRRPTWTAAARRRPAALIWARICQARSRDRGPA
jgi:hypothetical protein